MRSEDPSPVRRRGLRLLRGSALAPVPSPALPRPALLRRGAWILAVILGPGVPGASAGTSEPPRARQAGWVEWVWVEPEGLRLKAKLDTGARTSSLSALEVEVQEVSDGPDRVRFRLEGAGGRPGPWVERPVVRWVRIKRHEMRPDRRPVVRMELCLGGVYRQVETSLADRSKFNYPVLLGRNFLAGAFLVDAGATFALGGCSPPAEASDAEGEDEDEEELGEEEEGETDRDPPPERAPGVGEPGDAGGGRQ